MSMKAISPGPICCGEAAKKENAATERVSSTSDAEHLYFMRLACRISWSSNPVDSAYCVGCVIVDPRQRDDRGKPLVIATGFSREIEGNTHAEESALRKLMTALTTRDEDNQDATQTMCHRSQDGSSSPISTSSPSYDMYVTMEPCSKRLSGKPPCVETILRAKCIRRVFVGVVEPSHLIERCEGMKLLSRAGIRVILVKNDGGGDDDGAHSCTLRRLCLDPNRHILDGASYRIRPYVANTKDDERIRHLFESGMRAEDPSGAITSHREQIARSLREDLAHIAETYGSFRGDSFDCSGSAFFLAEPVQTASKKTLAAHVVNASLPLAGMVAITPTAVPGVAELRRLQVATSHRGKGLGAALVRHAEAWCRLARLPSGQRYHKMVLTTITLHAKAIRLYGLLGYERKGRPVRRGDVEVVAFEKDLKKAGS